MVIFLIISIAGFAGDPAADPEMEDPPKCSEVASDTATDEARMKGEGHTSLGDRQAEIKDGSRKPTE